MIRQAISCDICGRDKQQTNHWFVAYEHGSELRISGWSSQVRMSTKAKHLCGQTCMHKLVDDFMVRTIEARVGPVPDEAIQPSPRGSIPVGTRTDMSLTLAASRTPPARIAAPIVPVSADEFHLTPRVLPAFDAARSEEKIPPVSNAPAFGSQEWRVEAWRREQERERRSGTNAKASRRGSVA